MIQHFLSWHTVSEEGTRDKGNKPYSGGFLGVTLRSFYFHPKKHTAISGPFWQQRVHKMKTVTALIFGLAIASDVAAFVCKEATHKSLASSTRLHVTRNPGELSRRGFAESLAGAVAFLALPKPAFADDDTDSAGGVSNILQSSNLRSLKRAEKQFEKLELYAVANEYENIKLGIRNAPFSEVRKNSFALIKEYSDQPDKKAKLTASYEVFISAVETLDSTSSLGMRGRKLGNGALLQSFQATSKALSDWIAVAAEASASS